MQLNTLLLPVAAIVQFVQFVLYDPLGTGSSGCSAKFGSMAVGAGCNTLIGAEVVEAATAGAEAELVVGAAVDVGVIMGMMVGGCLAIYFLYTKVLPPPSINKTQNTMHNITIKPMFNCINCTRHNLPVGQNMSRKIFVTCYVTELK